MKYDNWQIGSANGSRTLRDAGIPALLAEILSARGLNTPELAQAFLQSVDAPLPDPMLLTDMAAARDRVLLALERGERICVFGDYDVDGITATCLLTEYLQHRGGDVCSYIPDRLDEGYGLSSYALERLAADGVRLIITVDCGITAVDEALLCRRLGVDLIITDHHTCGTELPDAAAVIDPHRPDDGYPFRGLAGVGVAFKLAAAIEGNQDLLLSRYCDLLALGTVADVMPLLEENRAMVNRGVEMLCSNPRLGLKALMSECGASSLNSVTIGYTVAPRINAAGRMGHADTALRLLMTRSPAEAASLAAKLCALNRERQNVEQTIYTAAKKLLAGQSPEVIVLASSDWHQGVVGIVASRLSEEFACPACLICLDGETGKASSRSYGSFPLITALRELSPLLERYGGHELAAGFTIRADRIDAFREGLIRLVRLHRAAVAELPALQLDCRITDPSLLTLEQVEALSAMEPCGTGCPKPMLCISSMTVLLASEVGGGKHLRLRLQMGNTVLNAIFFSMTAQRAGIAPGDVIEVAGTPQVNEYHGFRSVQLQVADLRLTDDERTACETETRLYQRYQDGEPISAAEAASLIPPRSEFAAVWRYLKASCQDGQLRDNPDSLCRKIARSAGLPVSFMRTRICLDVFHECSLLFLTRKKDLYDIRLQDDGHRVDLFASPTMIALRRIADAT